MAGWGDQEDIDIPLDEGRPEDEIEIIEVEQRTEVIHLTDKQYEVIEQML